MKRNLQITFRGMNPSDALSEHIRDSADKLEQFFDGITGCHVVVEEPHRHHQQGKHFHVHLDLHVPGKNIVVDRDQGERVSREDPYQAVNDAFDAARRQLQHYAEGLRAHH
jgi:ribosomal subunit interface protein